MKGEIFKRIKWEKFIVLVVLGVLALMVAFKDVWAGSSQTSNLSVVGKASSFNYIVDTNLEPVVETLHGLGGGPDRTVAAVLAQDGTQDNFVVNEVIVQDPDGTILDIFISTYGAEVIRGGELPDPPEELLTDMYNEEFILTDYYLVSVDLTMADTSEFTTWMEQLEFEGEFTFSSEEAVRLSAIIAKERVVNGLNITPNIVLSPHTPNCVIFSTDEYPIGSIFQDGFNFAWANDSNLQLTRAWQYFDLLNLNLTTRAMGVAVIDAGFQGNNDFPPLSYQRDIVDDDNSVLGENGGAGWHGTGVLSTIAARLDNQFGSVGTGGLLFEPPSTVAMSPGRLMLFKIADKDSDSVSLWTFSEAIDLANKSGGEVINLSWGGECGWWCRNFGIFSGMDSLTSACRDARDRGLIVVVSAGNDENDLDDSTYLPCEIDASLCVGAIDTSTKNAVSSSSGSSWGSNYGSKVNIWAPGDRIDVTPYPNATGNFSTFNGTSAAAPYISGLVVMMKAVKPSITLSEVISVLQNTANKSSDTRVKNGYVNAFEAIKKVTTDAGLKPQGDSYEPNDKEATAKKISTGTITATIVPGESDYYYFETTDFMDVSLSVTYRDRSTPGNGLVAKLDDNWFNESTTGILTFTQKMLKHGKHILHVYGTNANTMNCYNVQLSMTTSTIKSDKYDDGVTDQGMIEPRNETFDNRAIITDLVQTSTLIPISTIDNLNFHETGDTDFFEVTLADLNNECLNPGTSPYGNPGFVQGHLTINSFPNPNSGVSWPFEIKVYNADKSEFTKYTSKSGFNLKIECPHKYFSDGKVIFSVKAKDGRRNFYDIGFYYNKWDILLDIPLWLWDLTDAPLVRVLPPFAGLIPWMFPSNPIIIEQYLNGEISDPLPAEYGVFTWEDTQDLDLYLFAEGGKSLEITLYNADQQVIATTGATTQNAMSAQYENEKENGEGYINVPNLPPGIYVLEFTGDFSTVYSISIGFAAYLLTVTTEGTGGGTVTSNPGGINCGGDCEEAYDEGTVITLTATPDDDSLFAGWSPEECGRAEGCLVTMDEKTIVTARFLAQTIDNSTISLTPSYHHFGNIFLGQTSEVVPFTITNISDKEVAIETIALEAENSSGFNILEETCMEEPIAPSEACIVKVAFSPTSEGSKTTLLRILSNATETTALEAELSGEGVLFSCPAELIFAHNKCYIDSLHLFRDKILVKNSKGLKYKKYYYRHTDELLRVFFNHPMLFLKATEILANTIIPQMENSVNDKWIVLTEDTLDEGLSLLEEIIDLTQDELKECLIHLRKDLKDISWLKELGIEIN